MSMGYVRNTYGVPAKKGGRVIYTGGGNRQPGTIRSARSGRLMIQLDSDNHSKPFHPTWCLEYLERTGGGS